jgi:AbrB family looped-hinge helix DNA binding protein
MEIALTKMSSKGQLVIPQEMRKEFKAGDKLVLIKEHNRIVLKPMDELEEQLREDLEFARRTEEAYKSRERGEFVRMSWDDFMKELDKC